LRAGWASRAVSTDWALSAIVGERGTMGVETIVVERRMNSHPTDPPRRSRMSVSVEGAIWAGNAWLLRERPIDQDFSDIPSFVDGLPEGRSLASGAAGDSVR